MTATSLTLHRRPLRAGLAAVVGAAVLVPLGAASDSGGRLRLVVTERGGSTLVSARLPDSGRYALDYQHSYYDQPATEVFQADGTGFRLAALTSPSEAVLDYYDLSGSRTTTASGVHVLVPDVAPAITELPLIATAKGRRTLVVDGRRYPLYAAGGARHLLLRVAPEGRLDRLLPWRT